MCGIVGLISKTGASKKEVEVFEQMLTFDSIRGMDSTGVFIKDGDNEVLLKKTLLPQDLMELGQYKRAAKAGVDIMIGHNRAASVGKVTNKNAHPFDFDNVVGVHNGTLIAWTKFHNSKACDIDSEALYSHINEKGIEEAWGMMQGAAALMFYDRFDNTVNFIRNKERPLYHKTVNGTTFVASESWMIDVALSRAGIKSTEECSLCEENVLYTFKEGEFVSSKLLDAYKYVSPVYQINRSASTNTSTNVSNARRWITFVVKSVANTWGSLSTKMLAYTTEGKPVYAYLDSIQDRELIDLLSTDADLVFTGQTFFESDKEINVMKTTISLAKKEPELTQLDDDIPFDHKVQCAWCSDFVDKSDAIDLNDNGMEFVCKECALALL